MRRLEINVTTGEVVEDEFSSQEIAALPRPSPLAMPSLSAIQLRLALLGLGVTAAQVEAAIDAMPGSEIDREAARIQWEYATIFLRQHPLVVAIGAALRMTKAQIDEAWLQAATL